MLVKSLQLGPDLSITVWPYDAVQQAGYGRDIGGQELPGRDRGGKELNGVTEIRVRQRRNQSGSTIHSELEGRRLRVKQAACPCDGLP